VAGGGTAALAFVLAFVVESISRSRRRKALARSEPIESAGGPPASGTATATADIEGTMVLQLPPTPPAPPAQRPIPPKESSDAERTQRIQMPPRQTATSQKESQPRRPGLSTTYQSNGNGADRRGQDAKRVNGS
jgi:hypothetical protein